jgi:hypothetical protein
MDVIDVYVYRYISREVTEVKILDGSLKMKPAVSAATVPPLMSFTGMEWLDRSFPTSHSILLREIGEELLDEAIGHHRSQLSQLETIREGQTP